MWDDRIFYEAESVAEWSGLSKIWFSPGSIELEAHYWPIVYSTFWLEHKLWGFEPVGYHIVNLLLHFANTALLWHILARLTVPGAWLAAAIFAVHPVHVESVAWVIERKDLLSALFFLLAIICWMPIAQGERPRAVRYLATMALYVAGMLSKSIVISLPLTLLIWRWWQQGRVTSSYLFRLTPFVLVGMAITFADLSFSRSIEDISFDYSLLERALIAAHSLWFYAGKLFWPTDLAIIYPHWSTGVADPAAWAYLVGAVALAALLWGFRDRLGRGPFAGMSYFAVTLAPVLGFVDFGYMQFSFVADRYQYLASIGVIVVVVAAVTVLTANFSSWAPRLKQAVVLVVLAALGAAAWQQASIYQNRETFNRHIISLNPKARDAHANLGIELLNRGEPEEALALLEIELELQPDSLNAISCAGLALARLGRLDEAVQYYERALKIDAHDDETLDRLALAHFQQGHYGDALALYQRVADLKPNSAMAHSNLGATLAQMGRTSEALPVLERAYALDPTLDAVGSNLKKLRKDLGLPSQ